jgi:hypothetical protein
MTGRTGPRRGRPRARIDEQKRQRITAEAARIMAEEGVRDFQAAKRKAAERVGVSEHRHLPTNEEIHEALAQHLNLFHGDQLAANARRLRQVALDAMRFLHAFDPRIVGPVLTGTVTPTSEIQLHISADTPEEIALFLTDHDIQFRLAERRVRFGGDRYQIISAFHFDADGSAIEVCVFDRRAARETPLSPVDGRPMRRANLREMEQLLQQRRDGSN